MTKQLINSEWYFHGSPKKIEQVKVPSQKRPFFVAPDLQFCKNCFGDKSLVAVKFNLNRAKVFDFNSAEYLEKLDLPECIKSILFGKKTGKLEELYTSIAVFEELSHLVKYAKGSKEQFFQSKHIGSKDNVLWWLDNWFLPSINYGAKNNSQQISSNEVYDVFHWICMKIGSRVDKLSSENGVFNPKSTAVYIMLAKLFLEDVLSLGFNAFANIETKNGWSLRTFGILNMEAIESVKNYKS